MRKLSRIFIAVTLFFLTLLTEASGHPMGNFSINHYARIEAARTAISIHVVLDYAEIPTFQLLSDWGAGDIGAHCHSLVMELNSHFRLKLNRATLPLQLSNIRHEVMPGAGGLSTLRVSFDLLSARQSGRARVEFVDDSYSDRIGWKEIVVAAGDDVAFPAGNPYAIDRSAGLTVYPADPLATSPNMNSVSVEIAPGSVAIGTSAPSPSNEVNQAASNAFFSGTIVSGDRLSEILSLPALPLNLVLTGLAIALALGALHALSPGHGKTLVAAYLVGNRGTARHAVFLGAIVTFTHTAGVFLLGLVTLFAANYIVPEKLYPWMGLISGLLIVTIGFNLFRGRLAGLDHDHDHHGNGGDHKHEIPEGISIRSLLALGISGGIVPCPSALVVLLSAIALHRIELGLLLLIAFSMGLASTLVAVGLLVVRAGRVLARAPVAGGFVRLLPVASAGIITIIGFGIAIESFRATGLAGDASLLLQTQALVVLGLGLILGLKHATDADHIVAVTTFVSESKSLLRSCGIGVFWGIGHTISLAAAGVLLIAFKVTIPRSIEARLEFAVAVMLVALGLRVLIRTVRGSIELHGHEHVHSGVGLHSHWHFHTGNALLNHAGLGHAGLRPLLVGMVHGAAGSAALMLLVLSTIRSPVEAFLYILVFGFGSVLGMLLISCLIALPLHWARSRMVASYKPIQLAAGVFSCLFGVYLGLQIWFSMP